MAEYGFYQFYQSFMEFHMDYEGQAYERLSKVNRDKDEIHLESITIEQLRKPIVIVLCLNGLATIMMVVEILIFNWLKWRNRKH